MSPWAGKYRILGDGKGVIHARPSAVPQIIPDPWELATIYSLEIASRQRYRCKHGRFWSTLLGAHHAARQPLGRVVYADRRHPPGSAQQIGAATALSPRPGSRRLAALETGDQTTSDVERGGLPWDAV